MRYRLSETLGGFEVFVDSTAPLSDTKDWMVPIRLLPAMLRGRDIEINGEVSQQLLSNLDVIEDIFCSWIPGAAKVPVSVEGTHQRAAQNSSVSLFFSCGVDSFYSLVKHSDEISSLILVHGFDVFIDDNDSFAKVLREARDVAGIFGKRLVVVRTNLREEDRCCDWLFDHGPALAAVAYALEPSHSKVYLAGPRSYADMYLNGLHPVLTPLWSTEAVRIEEDGAETGRLGKIKYIVRYPEVVQRLRVCWKNTGAYNCGECEKCIRTMISLAAFGVLDKARFARPLDPALVRRIQLDEQSIWYWREFAELDLPTRLRSAVDHTIRNFDLRLPPHGGLRGELARCRGFVKQARLLTRAFLS